MLSFTNAADPSQNIQTMRLRDDPPTITQQNQRSSKKRKTPPVDQQQQQQQQQQQTQQPQQQPQQQPIQHVLPPAHALMHPMPGPMPPGYPYAPADYTPGGIPAHPGLPIQQQSQSPPPGQSGAARPLSSSKRAEQNRKAQRAFRERRDQHVKALESRSQLLDAALASADEANRRWEECRALVDQLRVENTALRAALQQSQLLPPNIPQPPPPAQANPPPPVQTAPNPIPANLAPPPLNSKPENQVDPTTETKTDNAAVDTTPSTADQKKD
ncbi:hypothetical protein CVT24_009726 [Panaeolus cyanescens]|uniref:BZIP domain-containing protein n=1 Tax=Panaeolus cyanescens TaxID=181874 RepID=A0A409Y9Y7_9AGAR|nr:hypothetical protein CVT24_009726 [Panaeolus cyanescens]